MSLCICMYFKGSSTLIFHEMHIHRNLLFCLIEGFTHLFIQIYTLGARHLDTGDRARNQTDKVPITMEFVYWSQEKDNKQISKVSGQSESYKYFGKK